MSAVEKIRGWRGTGVLELEGMVYIRPSSWGSPDNCHLNRDMNVGRERVMGIPGRKYSRPVQLKHSV